MNIDKAAPADNSSTVLNIRRLPLVHTVRATGEESHFCTRLVVDGALLTEGTMNVRHDEPLALELTLPKDTQLLSCSINAHDALPVDRGENRIELTLPAEAAGKATEIALSYTGHKPVLDPVAGRTALVLPEINLFVQTLLWDLQIPEVYELTALDGNVVLATPTTTSTPNASLMIRLRKNLPTKNNPTLSCSTRSVPSRLESLHPCNHEITSSHKFAI